MDLIEILINLLQLVISCAIFNWILGGTLLNSFQMHENISYQKKNMISVFWENKSGKLLNLITLWLISIFKLFLINYIPSSRHLFKSNSQTLKRHKSNGWELGKTSWSLFFSFRSIIKSWSLVTSFWRTLSS